MFDVRTTNEFGSDGASTPERRDGVARTMEGGVGEGMRGRPARVYAWETGKSQRVEILLKTKVVLEGSVVE